MPVASEAPQLRFLVFEDTRCLCDGPASLAAEFIERRFADGQRGQLLVFDADSGEQLDVDHSAPWQELTRQLQWLAQERRGENEAPARSGPGRPRLGVVAREVTLLPRHWQWLSLQPGGASATLRRLVEQARKAGAEKESQRLAQDATFRFLNTLAGDLPGFEDACRALYAGQSEAFSACLKDWPADVRQHAVRMAQSAF
ncbi:MAG: DUF2239 family protein [Xanthomonadales bacterium]|nr:DUF2239 family protein [Xanthomonadales bacterium]